MTTESDILYPHWQNEYEAALAEVDSETLKKRIKAAEAAIQRRLLELAHDSDHHTERSVIREALISLNFLKIASVSVKPGPQQ